ncbi:type II toxin-antitoxin system PemK/MazF family toxin [Poseidonibacter lekithochrous]|uniref:type II toxin-antitoxin system PemK/MazF family toxin n=1 Tax=Poseidonibacter TaxID=2321187 RepID=UPI001C09C47D|nr:MULTISPECIES: type II toxin-antitoxin system PemK/MazF family toxin [Poseidonibacter]MBU3013530.1 type II toxin-antitoxin system PemK/MazF family toxin [Poseidonibacter lekithochrous]MDO6826827.1 type II toxin-antitoxin system PemK/MazF family toxin [Poseidonibacter sp. 1_MG-2023]
MNSKYNNWNEIKKSVENENLFVGFKDRDIFYMKMGKNIGYEQDGKGDNFVRPIVLVKGFNKDIFFGIPLSTKIKEGRYYYKFEFQKKNELITNIALLSQMRLFSTKRLLNKIGMMSKEDFEKMKNKFKSLID